MSFVMPEHVERVAVNVTERRRAVVSCRRVPAVRDALPRRAGGASFLALSCRPPFLYSVSLLCTCRAYYPVCLFAVSTVHFHNCQQ